MRRRLHPFQSDPGAPYPKWLEVRRLGRIGYREGLELQRELHAEVLRARETATPRGFLLLLEHDPPVVTVSRRPGAAGNLIATEAAFAERGIRIEETDRGGDVTYHGPGQLVAYPIVDLNLVRIRIHGWIRLLEQVVIDALASFDCPADRDPGATGVWVGRSGDDADCSGGRKIAAVGVRVSRWITMHGLAVNVDPELAHFETIVPCGLVGRPVTSLARELAGASAGIPDLAQVTTAVGAGFARHLSNPAPFQERPSSSG